MEEEENETKMDTEDKINAEEEVKLKNSLLDVEEVDKSVLEQLTKKSKIKNSTENLPSSSETTISEDGIVADVGNLAIFNYRPIDLRALKENPDEHLQQLAR